MNKAFKRAALLLHPDKKNGDGGAFKALLEQRHKFLQDSSEFMKQKELYHRQKRHFETHQASYYLKVQVRTKRQEMSSVASEFGTKNETYRRLQKQHRALQQEFRTFIISFEPTTEKVILPTPVWAYNGWGYVRCNKYSPIAFTFCLHSHALYVMKTDD